MNKTFLINCFAGFFCLFQVSHHYIPSSHTYLSVFITLFLFFNHSLSSWYGYSNFKEIFRRCWVIFFTWSTTMRSSCFGHSISIKKTEVHGQEILSDHWIQRSCSKSKVLRLFQPQSCFNFVKNYFFCQFKLPACLLTSFFFYASFYSMTLSPINHLFSKICFAALLLLYFSVNLLPNSRNSEESMRPNLFECINKCSLKSCWLCKEYMRPFNYWRKNIIVESSHMRQRQITDQPSFLKFMVTKSTLLSFWCPCAAIMRKHNSLWHSSCATCVNKSATLSWSYFSFSFLNCSIIDISSNIKKVFPGNQFSSEIIFTNIFIPKYNSPNIPTLQEIIILFCQQLIFSNNDP